MNLMGSVKEEEEEKEEKKEKEEEEKEEEINNVLFFFCLFSHQDISDSLWPQDYSPPDSSGHEISQARIGEWVAISFSKGFS